MEKFAAARGACPPEDDIAQYAAGEMRDSSRWRIEQHLDECEACDAAIAAIGESQLRTSPLPPEASTEHAPSAPAAETDSRGLLRNGDRIQRYVIASWVGQGAMAAVYRALDSVLGREVALKVMHQRRGEHRGVRRWVREARALAALSHPNVVSVFDVGEASGRPFLAMEFVAGRSLRLFIGAEPPPLEQRIRWLIEIASALAAAHECGIVHRDVKPENVMIRSDGVAKVLDFGLARGSAGNTSATEPTETVTQEGVFAGTPAYMAPEQLRGEVAGPAADQFAWGVTAYEVLVGRRPWTGGQGAYAIAAEILTKEPLKLRALAPHLSVQLEELLDRSLSKAPGDRFASMHALLTALRTVPIRSAERIESSIESDAFDSGSIPRDVHAAGADSIRPSALPPGRRTARTGVAIGAGVLALSIAALGVSRMKASPREPTVSAAPRGEATALVCDHSTDLYVTPTGSEPCSFVSITSALHAANRSGDGPKTIHVAAGTYNQRNSGEQFPLQLRGDISLIGAGAEETIIQGLGEVDHQSAGGAITDDALGATIVTGSSEGTTRISGVTIKSGEKSRRFHTFGIFCDRGRASLTSSPQATPNLVVDHIDIAAPYDTGLLVTTSLSPTPSGCSAFVTSSHFDTGGIGAFALGCGAGLGEVPTEIAIGTADSADACTFDAPSSDGIGLLLWGCVSRASVEHAAFRSGAVGIRMDQRRPSSAFGPLVTTFRANRFSDLATAGIQLWRAPVIDDLEENRFARIGGPAIDVDDHDTEGSPHIARARSNELVGNRTGIRIAGTHALEASLDFGRADDPGDNVIACETSGVAVEQQVVGDVMFAGNFWDKATPRSATNRVADLSLPPHAHADVSDARKSGIDCSVFRTYASKSAAAAFDFLDGPAGKGFRPPPG